MTSQAQKLTDAGARAEYVKCFSGAAANLHNLDVVKEEKQKASLAALVRQAQEETVGCCDKPWRHFDEVDLFEEQFTADARLKRRRILVLDGPSKYGKTEFAKALVGPGRAVEVNCANCSCEPPLQGIYRPLDHDLILLDELKVETLLKNKRLLQGPPEIVVMGSTQSNRFTYQAFVYRKRIVIGSNTWKKELKKCTKKDRDWVQANTVYVKVTAPLWVE